MSFNFSFFNQRTQLLLFIFSFGLLSFVGILFVFEASLVESLNTFGNQYFIVKQHLVGLIFGLVAFLTLLKLPSKFWLQLSPLVYILTIVLLLMTFLPGIGLKLNGAHRWISLGPIRFQPVEALKFSLVLLLSHQLPKVKSERERLVKFLAYVGLPSLIVLLQPDLGSLLMVAAAAVTTYFLAGGSSKNLALLSLLAVPLMLLAIVIAPYRLKRLTTFLHPTNDPLGSSFQIRQISLALGRGGWFGVGVGNSQQKYAYVPEAATDSIFAIVGEELGFVGTVTIVVLYLIFFVTGFRLIHQSNATISAKIAGLSFLNVILIQTFFNLGAVVGLIPLTGMPLPFFSYGRSSQIMIWVALAYIIGLVATPTKLSVKSNRALNQSRYLKKTRKLL